MKFENDEYIILCDLDKLPMKYSKSLDYYYCDECGLNIQIKKNDKNEKTIS